MKRHLVRLLVIMFLCPFALPLLAQNDCIDTLDYEWTKSDWAIEIGLGKQTSIPTENIDYQKGFYQLSMTFAVSYKSFFYELTSTDEFSFDSEVTWRGNYPFKSMLSYTNIVHSLGYKQNFLRRWSGEVKLGVVYSAVTLWELGYSLQFEPKELSRYGLLPEVGLNYYLWMKRNNYIKINSHIGYQTTDFSNLDVNAKFWKGTYVLGCGIAYRGCFRKRYVSPLW